MKKIFALITVLALMFLSACSGGNTDNPTDAVTTAQTKPGESTTLSNPVKIITEWGTDLLPADFPPPPEGTYGFEFAEGKHETDEGNYNADWVRIKFICPEHSFYTFTNALVKNGYKGGVRKVEDAEYYKEGFSGYWQNGKHIVKIHSTEKTPDAKLSFVIDIVPCVDSFPEELVAYFPKFNGYSLTKGRYCAHDASLDSLESKIENGFSKYWHWEFRFSNGFIGVEENEFEAYCAALEKESFSGQISSSRVDNMDVITVTVGKEIGTEQYIVMLLYNKSLKTLDVAYANNYKLLTSEE